MEHLFKSQSMIMPKNEWHQARGEMLLYSKDYLVDEIARLKRKCIRYEKRLDYIWNDDTLLNYQKEIALHKEFVKYVSAKNYSV